MEEDEIIEGFYQMKQEVLEDTPVEEQAELVKNASKAIYDYLKQTNKQPNGEPN